MLLDSWGGHTDQTLFNEALGAARDCKLLVIPPKTTPIAQPLDVFFNYWWKYFAKRIADRVAIDGIDVNLWDRNSIIKMHSLIHNQLSADVYRPMIRYAWYKAGYTDVRPEEFQSVADFAFPPANEHCVEKGCRHMFFVRCGWCKKHLCFHHFYTCYHYELPPREVWVEFEFD